MWNEMRLEGGEDVMDEVVRRRGALQDAFSKAEAWTTSQRAAASRELRREQPFKAAR